MNEMKGRIGTMMVALVTIALLGGCADIAQKVRQETGIPVTGPLAKIMVFNGELLPGQVGKARGEAMLSTINVGGSIVLTAMGRDQKDNDIGIGPTWSPTNPGVVEITPTIGPTVTIKALKKGSTDILIEFSGIKRKFETIYVE